MWSKRVEWTCRLFVRSVVLFSLTVHTTVISHLFYFDVLRRQTDSYRQRERWESGRYWDKVLPITSALNRSAWTHSYQLPVTPSYAYMLLALLLHPASFALSLSLSLLSCLPAWLQKHRASIDSSQIIVTSVHYSSSLFLSISSAYIAAIQWCSRQIGGNGRKKAEKKINACVATYVCVYACACTVGLVRVELKISTFDFLQSNAFAHLDIDENAEIGVMTAMKIAYGQRHKIVIHFQERERERRSATHRKSIDGERELHAMWTKTKQNSERSLICTLLCAGALLHIRGIDNEMRYLEEMRGWWESEEEAKPMFRVNFCVCVCFSLTRNFVVGLCQQLEGGDTEGEGRERKEFEGEWSSDDHRCVVEWRTTTMSMMIQCAIVF